MKIIIYTMYSYFFYYFCKDNIDLIEMAGWLVGLLASWLVGWLADKVTDWLVAWHAGRFACYLAGWQVEHRDWLTASQPASQ